MNDTDNQRIVALLTEMRELQRQHLGLYQEAVRNQAASIELQRQAQALATRRLKLVPALLVVVLGLAIVVLVMIARVVWGWR